MIVNVLGTGYEVIYGSEKEFPALKDADGYCDFSIKKIVVDEMRQEEQNVNALADLLSYRRKVVRHEIVHAFLHESGLSNSAGWAVDEEIVDWIALQLPKIVQAAEKAGAFTDG